MKRKIISFIAAAAMLTTSVPSLAAQDGGYATREYVVSEFVQSVGRNNLQGNAYMLSTFKDADEVSDEYRNDFEKAAANGLVRGDDTGDVKTQG